MLGTEQIEKHLIKAGVKNLREFGYEHANESNIFTDAIYSEMFKRMLNDNKGQIKSVDPVIDSLLARIATPANAK